MSIECLNKALKIQFEGQTPTKRLILILLANYCDDENSCYPSYSHIAKLAGLKDPKHIARIIKEFEDLGLLKIQKRYKEDGGNTSNRYFLTLKTDNTDPRGLQTPTPPVLDTPTLGVSTPPNTKEEPKDDTKDINDEFKKFWKVYPRKENKALSLIKYKIITRKFKTDDIMLYLERYLNDLEIKGTEKKYIPHCSTWLSQKRFLDYEDYQMQEIKTPKEKKSSNNNWYDDLAI